MHAEVGGHPGPPLPPAAVGRDLAAAVGRVLQDRVDARSVPQVVLQGIGPPGELVGPRPGLEPPPVEHGHADRLGAGDRVQGGVGEPVERLPLRALDATGDGVQRVRQLAQLEGARVTTALRRSSRHRTHLPLDLARPTVDQYPRLEGAKRRTVCVVRTARPDAVGTGPSGGAPGMPRQGSRFVRRLTPTAPLRRERFEVSRGIQPVVFLGELGPTVAPTPLQQGRACGTHDDRPDDPRRPHRPAARPRHRDRLARR